MIVYETVVSFTFLCLSVVTDTVTRKALNVSQEIFRMVGKKCLCKGCLKNNTLSISSFLSLNLFDQREMHIVEKHKIRAFLPGNYSSATKKRIKTIRMLTLLCLIKHRAGSDVLRRKGLLSFFASGAGWKRMDWCKPLQLTTTTHWIQGCVDRTSCIDVVAKRKIPACAGNWYLILWRSNP
jgi:hypothetical protein